MKEELNLSQSSIYLNVPNMCRGQYKMRPNSGDLSLKGDKKKKLYGRRINYKPQESYQILTIFSKRQKLNLQLSC